MKTNTHVVNQKSRRMVARSLNITRHTFRILKSDSENWKNRQKECRHGARMCAVAFGMLVDDSIEKDRLDTNTLREKFYESRGFTNHE